MTRRAAEQGSELVRRLLAFARRQRLEPQPIDLNGASRSGGRPAHPHARRADELRMAASPTDVWKVFADQAQLELALMNLIINARDAMPAGGTVTISAENRKLGGGRAARRGGRRLCPPRGRGHRERHSAASISKRCSSLSSRPRKSARAAGSGSAWSTASPSSRTARSGSKASSGKGTSAELWLPRAPKQRPRRNRPSASNRAAGQSAPLRILLVDDHEEVRSTTAAMLTDFGPRGGRSGDGADALASLKSGRLPLRPDDHRLCDAACVGRRVPARGADASAPESPR